MYNIYTSQEIADLSIDLPPFFVPLKKLVLGTNWRAESRQNPQTRSWHTHFQLPKTCLRRARRTQTPRFSRAAVRFDCPPQGHEFIAPTSMKLTGNGVDLNFDDNPLEADYGAGVDAGKHGLIVDAEIYEVKRIQTWFSSCILSLITIIIGVVVLAVLGVLFGVILIFSKRSQQLNNQYGAEFDCSVKAIGEVKKG